MALDVDDLLEDLKDWLEQAESTQGVNGLSGAVPEPNKSYVAFRLVKVDQYIQLLRDPEEEPSLSPPDIGQVIQSYQPSGTNEHATDCATLAVEAHTESLKQTPSHQYIGDRVAT